MPGENAIYESELEDRPTAPKNMSTMSIVLGSISMAGGIVASVFPPTLPLGITLIVIGGVTVGGGSGYKIANKLGKKKRENKKKKEDMVNLHEKLNISKEQKNKKPKKKKINKEFNSKKVHIKSFGGGKHHRKVDNEYFEKNISHSMK